MNEFGERLERSFKQAAEIAAGTAKPGTYRITTYDDDGNPTVIADFSDEVLARIDAEIAAEEADARAVAPSSTEAQAPVLQPSNSE